MNESNKNLTALKEHKSLRLRHKKHREKKKKIKLENDLFPILVKKNLFQDPCAKEAK